MNVYKNKGLTYSNYLLDRISQYFIDDNKLSMRVETFYNCREQGYVLRINEVEDYNKALCIWVYAQRNSDDPTITWDYIIMPKENANMFNEESYINRTLSGNVDEVTMKAIDIIKEYFE